MSPVERPSTLAVVLTALSVGAYLGFIALNAWAPGLMITPVWGAVPLSFVLAAALLLGIVVVMGVYVLIANAAEQRQ